MIKTQLSTLSYIRNWRVILVYFLIIPILNMLLLVAVTNSETGQIDWKVATSSVLISGPLLALGSINNLLVGDINRSIILEVMISRPFSMAYWGSKILISSVVAETMVIINGLLLWLINRNISLRLLFMLSFMAVVSGVILGIVSFVLSMGMSEPYFFSNIISAVGYLVSGTLISFEKYPTWLRFIGGFFPYRHTIDALRMNQLALFWKDVPILVVWILFGIIAYWWQIKRVTKRSNQRTVL